MPRSALVHRSSTLTGAAGSQSTVGCFTSRRRSTGTSASPPPRRSRPCHSTGERRVAALRAIDTGIVVPIDVSQLRDDGLRPPVVRRGRGRPKVKRIRSACARTSKQRVVCGRCGKMGLNATTCPAPDPDKTTVLERCLLKVCESIFLERANWSGDPGEPTKGAAERFEEKRERSARREPGE